MKKCVSILLSVIMVMMLSVVPIYADDLSENKYLYEDKFIERYVENKEVNWRYNEVYYHYGESEEVDWCLIKGFASNKSLDANVFLKFSDFVLSSSDLIQPFDLKYAVYDIKKDVFIDLVDNYDELVQYDGLIDVLRNLDESILIGDNDMDGELTIIDATKIQKYIAQLEHLWDYYSDCRGVEGRFSDCDGDGEITVMDATEIQRKVARIE